MTSRLYYSIVLMLISPFLTLFAALREGNRRLIRWVLVLFTVVYGSTWGIEGRLGDGYRHWMRVYDYYVGLSFGEFLSGARDVLLFNSNPLINEDLYIHVISYVLGGVLNLPGLFFVVVALVYGYFFAGSMVKVFEVFPTYRKSIVFFGIAIVFIMYLDIQSMNTVRTWTGFWILFYACISYYQSGKSRYLWLMFLPPLFHIGFFIMAIPAWIVAFLGRRKTAFAALFFLSFITTIIQPDVAFQELERFEVGEDKIRAYHVEDQSTYVEGMEFAGESRWYQQYHHSPIIGLAVSAIAALFIISGRYFRDMNYLESSLFSIGILTMALSNSTWFLFAVQSRSETIAILFILAAVLIYWQRHYQSQKKINFSFAEKAVLYSAFLTFIPYYFYIAANTIEYLSVYMIIFPFFPWFSDDAVMTVREAIGYLIGL